MKPPTKPRRWAKKVAVALVALTGHGLRRRKRRSGGTPDSPPAPARDPVDRRTPSWQLPAQDFMLDLSQPTSFDAARRKARRRNLFRRIAGRREDRKLLSLERAREKRGPFDERYAGVRPIAISEIVGTAGRGSDFDRDWLPARREIRHRWGDVERAFPGNRFPPIDVYELEEGFFVVDGHHRVAIAKARGLDHIPAGVTQLQSRRQEKTP